MCKTVVITFDRNAFQPLITRIKQKVLIRLTQMSSALFQATPKEGENPAYNFSMIRRGLISGG